MLEGYADGGYGRRHAWPHWIFIHGTYIVNKGLIVLFFSLFLLYFGYFSVALPERGLIVLFFGLFCYFLDLFSFLSPGNFSADALGGGGDINLYVFERIRFLPSFSLMFSWNLEFEFSKSFKPFSCFLYNWCRVYT